MPICWFGLTPAFLFELTSLCLGIRAALWNSGAFVGGLHFQPHAMFLLLPNHVSTSPKHRQRTGSKLWDVYLISQITSRLPCKSTRSLYISAILWQFLHFARSGFNWMKWCCYLWQCSSLWSGRWLLLPVSLADWELQLLRHGPLHLVRWGKEPSQPNKIWWYHILCYLV